MKKAMSAMGGKRTLQGAPLTCTLLEMLGRPRDALAAAVLLLAWGCERRPVSADLAREVANAHFRAKYALEPSLFDVRVTDGGREWQVVYLPRGEAAGGTTTISVGKETGKVEREWGTQ